jgi:FixJ family two-component response regulator
MMGRCPALSDPDPLVPPDVSRRGVEPRRGGSFEAIPMQKGCAKSALISIVDDDTSMREAMAGLLRACGFAAETFASAETFLNSERLRETRCLIVDVQMPKMDGFKLHRRLAALGWRIPVIFVTAFPDDAARARAAEAGAVCFLGKPFVDEDLLRCVRLALNGAA